MIASLKSSLARLSPAGWADKVPGLARSLLPIVLLAIAITALVLLFAWRDQQSYKPVFGEREKVSVSDMIQALDSQGIAYRLHPDTGQVLVPDSQLGRVRMLLAARGVVAHLPAGLELMDKSDPLGVSQFVQDVRFRRGLEGELTQSIGTIDAVESARVHLAIARSSSFVVADGEKSSASVVLVLKPGRSLSNEQVAAIINLVANSVADLDPKRVSVVDQAGNFLSSRVDLSDGFENAQINDSAKHYQDETRRSLDDLLGPVVGQGNYKASVTADVDNDRVQETVERYGEAPKVTSEATRNESGRDPIALGVPGSLSNRPVAVASSPATPTSGEQKNATTRQYAYDRSVTQVQKSRGRLKRLNVAVVLNAAAAPGGKGWSPAALANVDRVLRGGLGVDAARGDQLVVSAMSFPAPLAPVPWWNERENLFEIGRWAVWALAAVLAFFLVFRPVFKLAQQKIAPTREVVDLGEPVAERPEPQIKAAAGALPEPDEPALEAPRRGKAMAVVPLLEDYDLPPSGSPVDVLVDHLRVLAAKEPERVAEVVRQWVQRNGRTE